MSVLHVHELGKFTKCIEADGPPPVSLHRRDPQGDVAIIVSFDVEGVHGLPFLELSLDEANLLSVELGRATLEAER